MLSLLVDRFNLSYIHFDTAIILNEILASRIKFHIIVFDHNLDITYYNKQFQPYWKLGYFHIKLDSNQQPLSADK
jgi:hypothetical protein